MMGACAPVLTFSVFCGRPGSVRDMSDINMNAVCRVERGVPGNGHLRSKVG